MPTLAKLIDLTCGIVDANSWNLFTYLLNVVSFYTVTFVNGISPVPDGCLKFSLILN